MSVSDVSTEALRERLDRGLEQLAGTGMPLIDTTARERLLALVSLLHKWNRVYNLTAVRDPLQMVDRHLLDSLVMLRWLPDARSDGFDVMDVGTGAGLPVLPLAIVRSDLNFVSIESNGKKVRFQRQALMELPVPNVTVRQQRVESTSDSAQLVLSRAFTAPEAFLSLGEHLCTPRGTVAIMLGQADRLPASPGPAFELLQLVKVDVPGTDSARHVALYRRQAE